MASGDIEINLDTDQSTPSTGAHVTIDIEVEGTSGGGGGVSDHGELDGLGDDDHTQYALADGSRGDFEPTGTAQGLVDTLAAEIATLTLTGNSTIENPLSVPVNGQELQFRLTQGGSGSNIVSWDGIFKFSTDLPVPTLSTSVGATDYVTFQYNTTTTRWHCTSVVRGF